MNDSERRPNGRDDERRDVADVMREALRATLEEKAWDPKYWESSGRHWEAVSPHGAYDVWAYPADTADAPRQALCHVSVTGYDGDRGMWVLGVPSPEEAARLFEEREDLVSSYYAEGYSVLDLATGLAVTQREAERLLEDPVKRKARYAERGLHDALGAARSLGDIGWTCQELRIGLDDPAVRWRIFAQAPIHMPERWGIGTISLVLTLSERHWEYELSVQAASLQEEVEPKTFLRIEDVMERLSEEADRLLELKRIRLLNEQRQVRDEMRDEPDYGETGSR